MWPCRRGTTREEQVGLHAGIRKDVPETRGDVLSPLVPRVAVVLVKDEYVLALLVLKNRAAMRPTAGRAEDTILLAKKSVNERGRKTDRRRFDGRTAVTAQTDEN